MKITICGSMNFAREMDKTAKELEVLGHTVFLPEFVKEFINGKLSWELGSLNKEERAERKKEYNLIKKHWERIKKSDAILVLNYEKNGIKNYIGANTFLEMGFAHILNKKIYLLNELPKFDYLLEEIKAIQPIIINGDLSKIK